jgi:hypothetical protein
MTTARMTIKSGRMSENKEVSQQAEQIVVKRDESDGREGECEKERTVSV